MWGTASPNTDNDKSAVLEDCRKTTNFHVKFTVETMNDTLSDLE